MNSQIYNSRDNHIGVSSYASSWQGQAPVMTNESLISNEGIIIRGYLSHGTDLSRANITFSGADASLVVEDTLRIHGELNMKSGSSIHIKPGGVLIVHMNYHQEADVVFKNEGKAVFLADWQTADNPSSISNSGSIYVSGTVTAVGTGITIKSYSSLPADFPSLYEFSRTNIIKTECTGSNSGTVTFSEFGATIIRWEMSTDFFRSKVEIANTSPNQPFSNLTKTTSFRAYYRTSSGIEKYSPGSTYVVLGQANGGSISGTTEVCGDFNNAFFHLQNYYGEIVQWESSTDNFVTTTKTITNSEIFSISNVSQNTQYRVLVENDKCSQAYSSTFYLKHFNYSKGGTLLLEGSDKVCKGNNSGELVLSDYSGSIVRWESSISENFSTIQVINSTASQLNFSNLENTTYYRVVVKSGPCSEALSSIAAIEVAEILGGTLTGTTAVCAENNSGTISLSGYKGNILRWESSTDDFATIQIISNTTEQFTYQNLNKTTRYRAVVGNGGICQEVYSTVAQITTTDEIYSGLDAAVATVAPASLQLAFPFNGNANDVSGNGNHGTLYGPTLTEDQYGLKDRAYYFDGSSYIATTKKHKAPGPNVFTLSIWFKTTSTTGGKLIGYGNAQTGTSTRFDRNIYMTDNGQLYYGVFLGRVDNVNQYGTIKTTASYNDGQWHHVAVSMSGNGAKMYVDGALTAQDPSITTGENFAGYWKVGFDDLGLWPEKPTSLFFTGSLDEVRVFDQELSAEDIYHLSSVGAGPSCEGESIPLFAETISGASYEWSGPGGFSSVEQNPVIENASATHAGVYILTYTKNGCSFQRSTEVIVTPASQGGTLTGEAVVCSGVNSGTITLSGHIGNVLGWESSTSPDFSTFTSIANTSTSYTYTDLTQTTYFRVVVQNSFCNEARSNAVAIETNKIVGGSLTGTQSICTGSDYSTITLSGHKGEIVRWESSTDQFTTIQEIASTSSSIDVSAPLHTTQYRAVVGNGGECAEEFSSVFELTGNPSVNGGKVAVGVVREPSDGLLESFPFSGDVTNATGNGNDGIIYGPTLEYDRFGMANSAFHFDGVDDIITTTTKYPSPGPQVFSISVWFKTSATNGGKLIGYGSYQTGWSDDYDRHLYLDDQGQLYFGVYTDGNVSGAHAFIQSTESFNDGQWHHAVATLSSGGMKLYVDGELNQKDETVTVAQVFSGFWRLGGDSMSGWPEAPSEPNYEGVLDDVLIYNRELSPEEIKTLYGSEGEVLCAGEALRLKAVPVSGATYSWSGPDGFFSNEPNPVIPAVSSAHEGTYTVSVEIDGCFLEGTTQLTVTPLAEGGNIISANEAVCEGINSGTLTLENYIGEIIRWESSTDGFVSDLQEIVHTSATLSFENLAQTTSYRALVQSGSCSEAYSTTITIEVIPASAGGSLSGSAEVCKGDNSGILSLSGQTGEVIRWESSADADFSTVNIFNNTTSEFPYQNLTATTYFRAVVKNGSCGEAYSTTAAIEVSEVEGGTVSGSDEFCSLTNSGTLVLSGHTGNIIRWESSIDGFVNDVKPIRNSTTELSYENVSTSTSFRAVVGSGPCAAVYSELAEITITPPSSGGVLTSASTAVCRGANTEALYLQDFVGQITRWERSNDDFRNHLEIIQHTQSEFSYSNLQETSSFRVVVQSGSCSEATSGSFTITVEDPAFGGVVEGGKRVKAGANEGELEVKNYEGNILYWESSTDQFAGEIRKISESSPVLSYKDIQADTWFRAVVQKGTCDPVYSQPALISVNKAPVAVADTFLIEPGKVFYSDRSLLENDYDPDQDPILLQAGQNLVTAEGNDLQIESSGTIIFTPQPGFAGTDSFQYQVCDQAGEASLCSYGTIVFQVQKGQVLVYQGLSPNQDLKNDHWVIENIEHYPNNLIQLYNPNGILVFEMQGYDNTVKVFSGIGNRGMGSSGQELPDGTYFYYIRLGEAKTELKGYIILNR